MDVTLWPALGAWVIRKTGEGRERNPGRVEGIIRGGRYPAVRVFWLATNTSDVIRLDQVECGLGPGYEVWHVPEGRHETSLGLGKVVARRVLGGRQQLLVDFMARAERVWLPWQRLRFVKGPEHRFQRADPGGERSAERFRLRNLAHALQLWNENTGSLSKFDIDPLPHQIHLVHHILASGNLNWLIADDVGLGKTIEAGLLIAALRQRGAARRILLVVPAGLTRQWQEDLKYKFGMDDFIIYGPGFNLPDASHWKLFERVIVSMDTIKAEKHLESFLAADRWDLVIFDEAHRLTRRQWGMKLDPSERYRMAASLRPVCENFVLLTATPHQGKTDQFTALLELLRPEMADEFAAIDANPEVLAQMVFRNRKSDVTDIDGNFVFHGQTSRMVQVDSSPELSELERELRAYLEQGYQAAKKLGQQGNAINFVMTVYRKLAASSIVTLHAALVRRLARLRAGGARTQSEMDARYEGEWEETQVEVQEEFFEGESARLETLIQDCAQAARDDQKMAAFLDEVVGPVLQRNPDERLLVFTEYRGTQHYIVRELAARYGSDRVHMLHGSMDVEERRESIRRFEHDGQFLVSTEAGGEGINLHRRCHILVNFDLPWNPMRLAQRIGRLYRYGQEKHVLAFNLQGRQSADELIVAKMYERLEQVAQDMAGVDAATSENLVSDIVGELADLVDVEEILDAAVSAGVQRTEENIEEALERARAASELQRELFQHAMAYDPEAMRGALPMGPEHLRSFIHGMTNFVGGQVRESRKYPGQAWRLELPDAIHELVPGLGRAPLVTLSRSLAQDAPDVVLLDLDHRLCRVFLELATDYDFEGLTARIALGGCNSLVSGMLRWQDDRGRRLRQEYVAVGVDDQGSTIINPPGYAQWLTIPATTAPIAVDPRSCSAAASVANQALDAVLAARSNRNLHPESREWLAAAWCRADVGAEDSG